MQVHFVLARFTYQKVFFQFEIHFSPSRYKSPTSARSSNIIAARKLIFPWSRKSRARQKATRPVAWKSRFSRGSTSSPIPACSRWKRRWIFDFPIEISDLRHGGPAEIRLTSRMIVYTTSRIPDLRRRTESEEGEKRAAKETRGRLPPEDGTDGGGCRLTRTGYKGRTDENKREKEKLRKGWKENVCVYMYVCRCWRQIESRARRDRPREHRRVCTVKITTRLRPTIRITDASYKSWH